MDALMKNIAASAEVVLNAEILVLDGSNSQRCHLLISPRKMAIEIKGEGCHGQIVVVHGNDGASNLNIQLHDGARLSLVELFGSYSSAATTFNIGANAECNITSVRVMGGNTQHDINLNGEHSQVEINTVQLTEDRECAQYNSNLYHRVSHCNSRTLTKSVAAGCSNIEFHGLVYVAQDAQQTNADQSSRNIEMDDHSKILVEPQLEIYADDVKCSHGATVGQLNHDAVWYMRQRGLSEQQAQRLQLEGFAMDVVSRCAIPSLVDDLGAIVESKLLKM